MEIHFSDSYLKTKLPMTGFKKKLFHILLATLFAGLAWSPSFATSLTTQASGHGRSHLLRNQLLQGVGKRSPGHPHRRAQSNKAPQMAMVNINQANAAKLASLKGIGLKKAQAVVKYRRQHGKFNNIDELSAVKGISINTIERNRSRMTV